MSIFDSISNIIGDLGGHAEEVQGKAQEITDALPVDEVLQGATDGIANVSDVVSGTAEDVINNINPLN